MSDIARHIERIHQELPAGTRLVAVSKFHTAETIRRLMRRDSVFSGRAEYRNLLKNMKFCLRI